MPDSKAQDAPKPDSGILSIPGYWHQALTLARSPRRTIRLESPGPAGSTGPDGAAGATGSLIPAPARALAGATAEFRLLETVGKGGMGVVYQAVQTSLGRKLAVKRVRQDHAADPEGALRFIREAELTGRLEHPNIIPVHELGRDEDGLLFYTMKLVEGRPWSQAMAELALDVNLGILARVMDAIAFAHARGVVHRDLKPENVMLGEFGEVYVMDWGLAAAILPHGRESEDPLLLVGGTPAYMAPEIANGRGPIAAPSVDIYLLGALLFEILTGEPPHPGEGSSEVFANAVGNVIRPALVQGELMDIALRAMATDPASRPPSVHALQETLRNYKSHHESNTLAALAAKAARAAAQDRAYATFQGAVFGYREALRLWPENRGAREALSRVLTEYALAATARGDLDLAVTLLDPADPDHLALLPRIQVARQQRRARQARFKALVTGSSALVAALLVSLSVTVVLVRRQSARLLAAHRAGGEQLRLAEAAHYRLGLSQTLALFADGKGAKSLELLGSLPQEPSGWERGLLACRLQARAGLAQTLFQGHAGAVAALAVSPDGRLAASGGYDHKVFIWETANGRVRRTFQGGAGWNGAGALAFSAAGLLAMGDGTVWEPAEAEPRFRLAGLTTGLVSLAFSPDGQLLAGTGADGGIRLWRAPGGTLVAERKPGQGPGPASPIRFSPDGGSLLWGGQDGRLHGARVGEAGAFGEELLRLPQALPSPVLAAAWSADGRIAAGARDGTIRVWAANGKLQRQLPSPGGSVPSLAFSPDGHWLAGGSLDGVVRVWSVGTGELAHEFKGHLGKADPVAFLADGRLVSGGNDGTLRVWWVPRASAQVEGEQAVASLGYLDGQRLLLGRLDGSLTCWDRLRDRVLWSNRMPSGSALALAVDPRQERVYCAGRDGLIRVWQAMDGARLAEWAGDGGDRLALAVSGEWLASAGKGGIVHVRQASTGARVKDLASLGDWVAALDFSPDGHLLAALSVSGGLRIWDTRDWQDLLAVKGTEGRSMSPVTLAFAPGGDRLAVGAWDKGVDVLDPKTGKRLVRLEGQDGWGRGDWTPDGRRFVSASVDGRFRVWDPVTGSLMLTLPLPEGQLQAMALGPDGRSVALGCLTLNLWDVGEW